MIKKVQNSLFKGDKKYGWLAFFIPFLIMAGVYLSIGIYPGSSRSILASDAFSQFANFHASFNNMMHGKQNILYTWNASLGLNYWSLISYYLGGIFTPIVFFFKNQNIPDALYLLTLLKIGAASLAFWFYAKQTYKLPQYSILTLSISYSLMSFITAHSELIMWLDIFMYLPLIILGINKVMDERKPLILFISYLLLFISNFYFGFMIGIFSVLYYLARLSTNSKRYLASIPMYLITSFLAGISSMIMILPALYDLRTNGETLTEISKFKTAGTAFFDIVIKNMIGVFDTTKYGSIPFIYVGLLPLIFCIYYFVSQKISLKQKIAYASIFVVLIISFYIEPLNLFWHGMHAPNMFLFRYSFLFSFLVVMLAGYGWEKFTKEDQGKLVAIIVLLAVAFSIAFFTSGKEAYLYATTSEFILTILFLALYLVSIIFYQLKKIPKKNLTILLLLVVTGEAFLNTSFMINGILDDWNYASRSVFSEPYPDYNFLVKEANEENKTSFKRLESLAPISSNDSFIYGYSGISMFSSIRNRHSSSLLNDLGYRSRGTNLNIRYQNNTLLMDSLMGIEHNISNQDVLKFGFEKVSTKGKYDLYQNKYALPLGMMTDSTLYDIQLPESDNLGSQEALVNQLADLNEEYFTFTTPKIVDSKNTEVTHNSDNSLTLNEIENNVAKDVTFDIFIPGGNQAYVSLFPKKFGDLGSSTATINTQGTSYKTQIGITGQYYNLGYFEEDANVRFTLSFYGTPSIDLVEPPVVLLDIQKYQSAMSAIAAKAVDFKVSGRHANAHIEIPEEQVLLTTIPFDEGWTVKINNKKVSTRAFEDGFLSFNVPSGTHDITLSFTPPGLILGVICFVLGIGTFTIYYLISIRKISYKKNTVTKKS